MAFIFGDGVCAVPSWGLWDVGRNQLAGVEAGRLGD
jgi:hypothetical protein